MASIFGTKEEILARIAGFERMNAWTDANSPQWSADEALAAISDLYALLPPATRARRDDPTYEGARFMRETLGRLRG